jgi:hypothetical protein
MTRAKIVQLMPGSQPAREAGARRWLEAGRLGGDTASERPADGVEAWSTRCPCGQAAGAERPAPNARRKDPRGSS